MAASIKLSMMLTLFLGIILCSESTLDHGFLLETNITIYVHDYFSGPNATTIAISTTPLSDDSWIVDNFGKMYYTDNPVTEGREPESDYLGRAQGTFVSSAIDGSSSQITMSVVFDSPQYQGSTLEIQGAGSPVERIKEVSVVSGTGQFRYARGFATIETIYYDRAANYSVAEWNISIEHYH